jgi:predicted transcriptional regulator
MRGFLTAFRMTSKKVILQNDKQKRNAEILSLRPRMTTVWGYQSQRLRMNKMVATTIAQKIGFSKIFLDPSWGITVDP